jgi:tryptophanase
MAVGLGCHVDAKQFCPRIPQDQYPSAAFSSAFLPWQIKAGLKNLFNCSEKILETVYNFFS